MGIGIAKEVDTPVPDGAVIALPMMLKDTQTASDRITLKIQYGEGSTNGASARPKSAPGKRTSAKDAEPEDDEVAEKNRMQFVELLLKTREIASGSTYEDAIDILKHKEEWNLLDEQTRRECFEIFVEYLDKPHKKDKKHDKKKKEKHKTKDEDEAAAADAASPEATRKRRRDRERKESASAERQRKGKREKKDTEKERDRSQSGRRRDGKRR